MKVLITGGAGFIGSAVVRYIINRTTHSVVNIDKLTYAANLENVASVAASERYSFVQADICDQAAMQRIFSEHQPDCVMHLAAESHVDNSISASSAFIQTNIVGTHVLLEVARHYWLQLSEHKKAQFVFHHVSTDEVYGDLSLTDAAFTESSRYWPSSPYSASKASADHLVRAWHRTYGLPIVISCSSNNYGPYQHHEKLIPKMIENAVLKKPLPIYGTGTQVRDWLHVDDHAEALYLILTQGRRGETYNVGGSNERRNVDIVHFICEYVDQLTQDEASSKDLIQHVTDRAGHDQRYALNIAKMNQDLGWQPNIDFESGLKETVRWYYERLVKPASQVK